MKPTTEMLRLLSGYWWSQCLYVLAELNIADRLAAGPRSAASLAEETNCRSESLYRLLRAMASAGILREPEPQVFESTDFLETLRSDRNDSLRPVALLGGHPAHWQAWGNLLHSVRTGESGFALAHQQSFFERLEQDPNLSAIFQQAMNRSANLDESIAASLDSGSLKRICDIGGGSGNLASHIARRRPEALVILFDREQVISSAHVTAPVELRSGDFLVDIPAGCDAYLLKFVLHDWADAEAVRILQNCAEGLTADGRVFVIETILPGDAQPAMAKGHDVNMLVLTGGCERTLAEYSSLFVRAGLQLDRVIPVAREVSIIQARHASS